MGTLLLHVLAQRVYSLVSSDLTSFSQVLCQNICHLHVNVVLNGNSCTLDNSMVIVTNVILFIKTCRKKNRYIALIAITFLGKWHSIPHEIWLFYALGQHFCTKATSKRIIRTNKKKNDQRMSNVKCIGHVEWYTFDEIFISSEFNTVKIYCGRNWAVMRL